MLFVLAGLSISNLWMPGRGQIIYIKPRENFLWTAPDGRVLDLPEGILSFLDRDPSKWLAQESENGIRYRPKLPKTSRTKRFGVQLPVFSKIKDTRFAISRGVKTTLCKHRILKPKLIRNADLQFTYPDGTPVPFSPEMFGLIDKQSFYDMVGRLSKNCYPWWKGAC